MWNFLEPHIVDGFRPVAASVQSHLAAPEQWMGAYLQFIHRAVDTYEETIKQDFVFTEN